MCNVEYIIDHNLTTFTGKTNLEDTVNHNLTMFSDNLRQVRINVFVSDINTSLIVISCF